MGSKDVDFSGLTIAFKSYHGTYLCAYNGDKAHVTTKPHCKTWEQWSVIDKGNNIVSLRSFHSTFLRAWPGERAKVGLHNKDELEETFNILSLKSGLYAIRSVPHGGYVSSYPGNDAKIDMASDIQNWEEYSIKIVSKLDSIKNVIFSLDKPLLQTAPKVLSSISLKNQNSKLASVNHDFNVEIPLTSSFTQKYGVKIASKTSITAKLPLLTEEGKIGLSNEVNIDWTPGRVITNTKCITSTVFAEALPQSSLKISLSAFESVVEIPWSATAIFSADEKEICKTIGGVWNGTMVYDVNYVVESENTI
ncbi:hypothetical protein BC937DRAFT_89595 [Endogone sp. FLAS-F59071]|nr:hypothetical protein BC937DRAFT_89595 [Endogone sp. FLAS-F59071]|eukprot:RUS17703.1 hypothetical protein BC937DRAFT_89595 [Endogone sp. FLAS-F59071]